jgi:hypothetical protein
MALTAMVGLPTLAAAQLSSRDLSGTDVSSAHLSIAVGQKVSVTTADGRKIKGRVLSLSPTTLDIGKGEVPTTRLAIEDVQRVQATDSVTNGVIKGALGLGLAGFLVGSFADASNAVGEVFGKSILVLLGAEPEPIRNTHHHLTGAVAGVAVGALLGYALDAGNEKTIFQRGTLGMKVAVRPIVTAEGKGVGVHVRW